MISAQREKIEYKLSEVTSGEHKLSIQVWCDTGKTPTA